MISMGPERSRRLGRQHNWADFDDPYPPKEHLLRWADKVLLSPGILRAITIAGKTYLFFIFQRS
jgi:hypothetical protein